MPKNKLPYSLNDNLIQEILYFGKLNTIYLVLLVLTEGGIDGRREGGSLFPYNHSVKCLNSLLMLSLT